MPLSRLWVNLVALTPRRSPSGSCAATSLAPSLPLPSSSSPSIVHRPSLHRGRGFPRAKGYIPRWASCNPGVTPRGNDGGKLTPGLQQPSPASASSPPSPSPEGLVVEPTCPPPVTRSVATATLELPMQPDRLGRALSPSTSMGVGSRVATVPPDLPTLPDLLWRALALSTSMGVGLIPL